VESFEPEISQDHVHIVSFCSHVSKAVQGIGHPVGVLPPVHGLHLGRQRPRRARRRLAACREADTDEERAMRPVDPWRFTGTFLTGMLERMIPEEPRHGPIPWTPVTKPVSESKVALLTTAGISMRDDAPFDMESERQHPTRGDSSWRRLRADATARDIVANHLHIDTSYIERDLAVALPLERLHELAARSAVGSVAASHYSVMGFQGNDSSRLENESAPAIAEAMRREEVDLALLAPV